MIKILIRLCDSLSEKKIIWHVMCPAMILSNLKIKYTCLFIHLQVFVCVFPGSGRYPGNGYPLQYSCLDNSMNRGGWQATVHGVLKSWT